MPELVRVKTLGIGHGLLANVMFGYQVKIGLGDLDEVAKRSVVLNLEVGDTGFFAFACLKFSNPSFAPGSEFPQSIKFEIIPLANDRSPLPFDIDLDLRRQILFESLLQKFPQRVKCFNFAGKSLDGIRPTINLHECLPESGYATQHGS